MRVLYSIQFPVMWFSVLDCFITPQWNTLNYVVLMLHNVKKSFGIDFLLLLLLFLSLCISVLLHCVWKRTQVFHLRQAPMDRDRSSSKTLAQQEMFTKSLLPSYFLPKTLSECTGILNWKKKEEMPSNTGLSWLAGQECRFELFSFIKPASGNAS